MAHGPDKPGPTNAEALRLITAVNDLKSLRQRMVGTAAKILEQLENLALYAESEQVRLGACKDLLDRVGLRAGENEQNEADRDATPEEAAEAESIAERIVELKRAKRP